MNKKRLTIKTPESIIVAKKIMNDVGYIYLRLQQMISLTFFIIIYRSYIAFKIKSKI